MDKNSKFSFSKEIAWQIEPINCFVYIFQIKCKKFILLEEISKDIWMLIKEKKSFYEIVKTIASEYEVEYDVIENDVHELISDLIGNNVIEVSN